MIDCCYLPLLNLLLAHISLIDRIGHTVNTATATGVNMIFSIKQATAFSADDMTKNINEFHR